MREEPETEAAEAEVNAEPGFKEGDEVWVEDANGKRHPGVFVGMNEAAGWFGGGPSAYVVHPEGAPGRGRLARPHRRALTAAPTCGTDATAPVRRLSRSRFRVFRQFRQKPPSTG